MSPLFVYGQTPAARSFALENAKLRQVVALQIMDYIETAYSTTYTYDDFNRLTNATANAFSRSYSFDEWGNIKNFAGLTLSYQTNASGAPSTNRINSDSQGYGYSYDSAGNMTTGMGQSYSYDGANRLKEVGTGGANVYGYDGDGKRVKKTEGGSTTYYIYSSKLGQSVMEVNANSVQRAYVYSGSKLVAMQATDGQFYWLHTNHLGNSRAMTDSSGNLTYKGHFDPYGATLTEWANSGNTNLNSKKFTGYERDSATGLDYANARMYNSARGRFTVPDMKGLGSVDVRAPQSLNRYAYTSNDPVNFVDPSGLDKEPFIIRFYTFAPYPNGGGATGGGGNSGTPDDDPKTKDPTGRSGGGTQEDFLKWVHDSCKNYVPSDLSSLFSKEVASLIMTVSALTGVSQALLAVTWAAESGFSFNPVSHPNVINGIQTYDVGPMQLNDYYTADEVRRSLYDLGPYSWEDIFGTAWGKDKNFNGNPFANVLVGAKKLKYLVDRTGSDRDAAVAYVGSPDSAGGKGRKAQYDKYAAGFDAYFDCARGRMMVPVN